ncbi:MAG TPA: hypothetical protein VEV39_00215 [Gemmatimonadales bacterium]|nr:hypothetical protein [Gemmatimonadales bacterium]
MRFVTPQLHRILDFVTVVAFALAPTIVPLAGFAAILAYALAVVHLAVTLSTEFAGTGRRPLPLSGHGALELMVGIALVVLPFLAGWMGRERAFYLAAGAVILVVFAVSQYRGERQASAGAAV